MSPTIYVAEFLFFASPLLLKSSLTRQALSVPERFLATIFIQAISLL
jgi:hypothetical protein